MKAVRCCEKYIEVREKERPLGNGVRVVVGAGSVSIPLTGSRTLA